MFTSDNLFLVEIIETSNFVFDFLADSKTDKEHFDKPVETKVVAPATSAPVVTPTPKPKENNQGN